VRLLQKGHGKTLQMKTTYLVEGVVSHAAGAKKNALCAPQAAQKLHASPATMKYLMTKMCNYKEQEKNIANEDRVPRRGVVLHAAGGAKITRCTCNDILHLRP
jgi:hypothetical protein